VGTSSSDSEQDLEVDGLGAPASTIPDTESSGSDGPQPSAGIDLPTLLEHVDRPLRLPVQRATARVVACHIAHQEAPVSVTHAGLLRTAMNSSKLLDVVTVRRRISRKRPFDSKVLGDLFENPSNVESPAQLTRSMHQGGFAEFRHWFVREIDKPWKQAQPLATQMWKNLPKQHKYHWHVIKKAMGTVSRSEVRGCVRRRIPVVFRGLRTGTPGSPCQLRTRKPKT